MPTPTRILLLDDDKRVGQVLAKLLLRAGFVPTVATTVSEALRACALMNFDLVITEIWLPDGDALPLLAHCRQQSPFAKGIVVSCFDDPTSMVRAKAAGFAEYVLKPIYFEQLMGVIQRIGSTPQTSERPETATEHDSAQ